MTTATEIISDTYFGIGVYATNETMTSQDAQLGLRVLNDMIDSWSNETLSCYANIEGSVVLQPAKYQYTIGLVGADITQQRPLFINPSPGSCYILDPNGNRFPMQVIEQEQWNLLGNITATVGNYPTRLFYNPQFPLGIINIYPVPNTNYTLFFDSRLQLTEFADLTTDYTFPPGYTKAFKDNLSVEVWRYFKPDNVPIPQTTLAVASRSKGNIKRTNFKVPQAVYDPEIVARGNSTFNIYNYNSVGGNR